MTPVYQGQSILLRKTVNTKLHLFNRVKPSRMDGNKVEHELEDIPNSSLLLLTTVKLSNEGNRV